MLTVTVKTLRPARNAKIYTAMVLAAGSRLLHLHCTTTHSEMRVDFVGRRLRRDELEAEECGAWNHFRR